MKPGDLVKITRASIGVPTDTVGLIVDQPEGDLHSLYRVYLVIKRVGNTEIRVRRYLGRDLEVIK